MPDDAEPRPLLDEVLLGAAIIGSPGADAITDSWIELPLYREAFTILRRAQRTGQRLGNLIAAGEVLAHEGGSVIHLPRTLAATAVCAAGEVPLATIRQQAEQRVVELALRRLGRRLALYANVAPAILFAALASLRAECMVIEELADIYGVPVDSGPVARAQQHPAIAHERGLDDWAALVRDSIAGSTRNATLARLTGHLLRRRPAPRVVRELILAVNHARCRPPLPDEEVDAIVDVIARRELARLETAER